MSLFSIAFRRNNRGKKTVCNNSKIRFPVFKDRLLLSYVLRSSSSITFQRDGTCLNMFVHDRKTSQTGSMHWDNDALFGISLHGPQSLASHLFACQSQVFHGGHHFLHYFIFVHIRSQFSQLDKQFSSRGSFPLTILCNHSFKRVSRSKKRRNQSI